MPWHDIMVQIDGAAAKDVGINFIQRWNYIMTQTHRKPFLLPFTTGMGLLNLSKKKPEHHSGSCRH